MYEISGILATLGYPAAHMYPPLTQVSCSNSINLFAPGYPACTLYKHPCCAHAGLLPSLRYPAAHKNHACTQVSSNQPALRYSTCNLVF